MRYVILRRHSPLVIGRGCEKSRGYVTHGLRVLNRSSWCQIAERYDLFMTVGLCLNLDRRFMEAIRCFEAASEWGREHFTEDDDSRLTSEHGLASAYLEDRRIKEAIEIFGHMVAEEAREKCEWEDIFLTVLYSIQYIIPVLMNYDTRNNPHVSLPGRMSTQYSNPRPSFG